MWGANRYRTGYTGRSYNVTGGHEAEAKAAQQAKPPSRIGLFVLRVLGYKGTPGPTQPGPGKPPPPQLPPPPPRPPTHHPPQHPR